MTVPIKILYRNILENSTIAVTSENTAFPKYRLHDRDIGKLFKGTAFANPFQIHLDQGASPIYEIDRLLIPAGHNFNGLTMDLIYSENDIDWFYAVQWTQGDALLINKSFTAQTKRYWNLNIFAPATIAEMPEMFLSKAYTFQRNPGYGLGEGDRKNTLRDETKSGRVRLVKFGEPKRWRQYSLTRIGAAQKADFETWDRLAEGIKSVYIEDHNGVLCFAELIGDLNFRLTSVDRYSTDIELLETL